MMMKMNKKSIGLKFPFLEEKEITVFYLLLYFL